MANHLGARKDSAFKAVSTAPSINKTPVGSSTPPLPYPVTEDLSSSLGTVPNVRFNGDPAYVLSQSTQPSCKGDAAGSCNGVKSGTVSGEVKPVKGSSTVRITGKPVIREGDPCTLNGGNCPGIYVTQSAPGAAIEGGKPSASSNPPVKPETPKEEGWWGAASPWVHGVLGVASFVPGLSVVTGAVDAGIYAAEGDMVEAGLSAASMIPGGKVVTTAGKLAKGAVGLAKGAHVAEEAAKAAKVAKEAEEAAKAAKLAKEAEEAKKAQAEAERLRKLKEEGEAAEKGKDGLKVKLKRMKEHLVKCFKKNAKGDPKEYDRQLLEQEKGLNDLSVKEYLEGRARYQEIGRAGTGAAQEQARAAYSAELTAKFEKALSKQGIAGEAAVEQAKAMAAERMKTLAALHNPDMIAGGKDVVTMMGDRGVNSSIGSQWKDRVAELDDAAKKVPEAERGGTKMNAKLKRCQ
ncbi:polymorphic toxin type 15 domain-containing protein [Burkholderia cepacia]|uniref:polymorphic toxin type 15 domain-containing protein n=1 Tax=Burkholderia cepacia TaxID=292 RepID=UPI0009BEFAA2|nr:polymorphic toxin type 15 domain-containing protein [Burkholderia cepacia]MCA8354882.1 polymorphic toxin type 15 domain-containing protein [Burkholderia cepacia]